MMRLVSWLSPTANGRWARSSAISATSAVSSATSEPAAPMATPTLALASGKTMSLSSIQDRCVDQTLMDGNGAPRGLSPGRVAAGSS